MTEKELLITLLGKDKAEIHMGSTQEFIDRCLAAYHNNYGFEKPFTFPILVRNYSEARCYYYQAMADKKTAQEINAENDNVRAAEAALIDFSFKKN